ncbi:MAG: hypothetical protein L0K86_03590 [Actinomycetia bacterium]|nr:hypothetical protein [Actinomycetes bacterium]
MASEAVRCNTGVELTVTEYLLFDAVPHADHAVPRRLHCDLQDGHEDAHAAFAQSPGTEHDRVWWMRWDHSERAVVELGYCVTGDPDRGEDDPGGDCLLPKDHRGGHTWQLVRPTLDFTRGADAVSRAAAHRLRAAPAPAGPLIRVHRFEHILAIKWPEFERWLMIWPDEYPDYACTSTPGGTPAAATEWRPLAFGDTDFDRPDWVDPAADRHRDLVKWTKAIRDRLAATASSVGQTLDLIEAHPYNR